jgi:hypothetical protein
MIECVPPCVAPDDIIDAADVRRLLKIKSRATLIARRRETDFPEPITRTGTGVELWDRRDIEMWLRDQGDGR